MAEHLPPELFEHILSCLTDPLDDEPVRITENKRTLSRWSLTCRYWARHCRPYLFWKLALRSREDALAFCQFVKSSTDGTPIGHYVWQLALYQQCPTPSMPWMHLILLSMPSSLLPHLEWRCICLGSDEPVDSVSIICPIQYGLPTSHPNLCLPPLAFGVLQNIRVNAFEDLTRILCSIPAHMLELRGLSWKNGSHSLPDISSSFFSAVRRSTTFRCTGFNIVGCTAAWPFMLFFLAVGPPPRIRKGLRPVFLDPDELSVVLMLARLVMDDCKCTACKPHNPDSRTYHIKLHKPGEHSYNAIATCYVSSLRLLRGRRLYQCHCMGPRDGSASHRVRRLEPRARHRHLLYAMESRGHV